MTRTIFIILALGFPNAAWAQPALEGQGNQSQGIGLAKGTVNGTVESAGSLSLGRGDDHIEGGVQVTINGATFGIGNPGAETTDIPPGLAPPSPGAANGQGLAPAEAFAERNALPACSGQLPSSADLEYAVENNYRLELTRAECTHPERDLLQLLSSTPRISRASEGAIGVGVQPVSITINNATVIIGIATIPANH